MASPRSTTFRWSQFISRDLERRNPVLDSLRGLMVLLMVLVNHSPPDAAIYAPLVHAPWHGWSLADTVFPGFLFCVGISICLAMSEGTGRPLKPTLGIYGKVLRRFALLMILNFLLLNFPYYELDKLHLTGTLALIAWCYLIVAAIHLHCGWRAQLGVLLAGLALQWAAYALLPVPGLGSGVMAPQGNAAQFIDRLIFAPLFGPQGYGQAFSPIVLPTLGAIMTTLVGLLVGHWLSTPRALSVRVSALFAVALALLMLGLACSLVLPLNKAMWTASYAVFMAGVSMQLLAALYWLTEFVGLRVWLRPMQVAGANALFFYVFAQCLQRVLVYGRLSDDDGNPVRLRNLIYDQYFAHWPVAELGSLAFALVFLAISYGVVLVLYRKRIFIKL